jgi:UDP-N-acetylglucosamine--N-acetylmuramyl-(pentapeptide) pyrophosphoryl-undecaprenol N-acetylglucosamine transferase
MAGGGTGGHVIPALAVARELRTRGHRVVFIGTQRGVESRLVPQAGFPLELIQIGGLKGIGPVGKLTSLAKLVVSTARELKRERPAAVFSMGGFVAGPPVIAAMLRRIPVVAMEPNAVPGIMNRYTARWVSRALITFPETAKFFPASRTELTGLPVREEFFHLAPLPAAGKFTILITGGSQGSRTLNQAARQSWPLFQQSTVPIRILHQAGTADAAALARDFAATGLEGQVSAFFEDMPASFSQANLIICRAGAGAVSELAAAGKPSVLIPFPFAADDHQLKNAESFANAGAALLVLDRDWTGQRLFETVRQLISDPNILKIMSEAAKRLAKPGAAQRAADILENIH